MITFLDGIIEEKTPTRVVLNVQGVGYEVFIPLSTYDRLPGTGESCRLLVYDHIREDTHMLFGFIGAGDREMFTRLLSISGIGPKLALSALSGLTVRDLKNAVVTGDVKMISSVSGIGKKMAERMIVELRDKLSAGETLEATALGSTGEEESSGLLRDGVMALIALGYKQNDAWKLVRKAVEKLPKDAAVEDIIRLSLTS